MMLKRTIYILFAIALLRSIDVSAQYGYFIPDDAKSFPVEYIERRVMEVIDTVNIAIDYTCTYKVDLDAPDYFTDHRKLLIGKRYTYDFSYDLFRCDSVSTALFKSGARSAPMCGHEVIPEEVITNLLLRETYHTARFYGSKSVLRYKENIPKIQWTILPEKKVIHSYSCQKATSTFLGRNYEAWFTMGIPISVGPYKFLGLPGLILEIKDTDNDYHWLCTGISLPKKVQPIVLWDYRYQDVSKKQFFNTIKTAREKFASFLELHGHKVSTVNNKPAHAIKFLYNPIEKVMP
ncbi:GLPGLI family protein [Porphyromonas levii]|uniref:GLPGLI family protein n=1 Tax=Porphyromonas levii TaxID=28114 RepID=A0A4Y8WLZ3_9PORP|nr:GLPGLI family protein [Porphyromonas levii]TFH93932.1 GLPGLI family protein [Porphyromonas levii]TFH94543.1 GLPGLI family protein [Porphyromonas levii]